MLISLCFCLGNVSHSVNVHVTYESYLGLALYLLHLLDYKSRPPVNCVCVKIPELRPKTRGTIH